MANIINRFPSGGGAKINGVIEKHAVLSDTELSAFDYVRRAYSVPNTAPSTNLGNISGGKTVMTSIKLSEGKVLTAYDGGSYYLYCTLFTYNDSGIISKSTLQLSTTTYSGYNIRMIQLTPTSVLIFHADSQNYRLAAMIVTISGMTITKGTDTIINATTYTSAGLDAIKTEDGKIFATHTGEPSYYTLYGTLFSISGSTLTVVRQAQLMGTQNSGSDTHIIHLSGSRYLVGFIINNTPYGMVVRLDESAFAKGAYIQLAPIAGGSWCEILRASHNSAVVVFSGTYTGYALYGVILEIEDMTITLGILTQITKIYSGYGSRCIGYMQLGDSQYMILHPSNSNDSNPMLTIFEMKKDRIIYSETFELLTTANSIGKLNIIDMLDNEVLCLYSAKTPAGLTSIFVPIQIGVKLANINSSNLLGITAGAPKNGFADVYVPNKEVS